MMENNWCARQIRTHIWRLLYIQLEALTVVLLQCCIKYIYMYMYVDVIIVSQLMWWVSTGLLLQVLCSIRKSLCCLQLVVVVQQPRHVVLVQQHCVVKTATHSHLLVRGNHQRGKGERERLEARPVRR